MVVEFLVSAALVLGPPTGATVEGPEVDADAEASDEPTDDPEPDAAILDGEDMVAAPKTVDDIVEQAAKAAQDRAWLERNGRVVSEYVSHLDALANVNAELDGCGRAVQAELRMGLALAYYKLDGMCADDGERSEVESEGDPQLPVFECYGLEGPRACAEVLLEYVAEFASTGQGGLEAPFSQAFGCPHAIAEMSVEQMFGACTDEQYQQAITRWEDRQDDGGDKQVEVWPVPRWAGIVGVAGGAALVIGGAVLLGIDGKCPGGYDPVTQVDQCPSVYNTNVGGGIMVGVGVVAMLGMGTVLAVTEVQRKRRGQERESALRRRLDRAQALTGLRLLPPRRPLMLQR
ncbi:MAG: hypothetical protein KC431_13775 [Myxococcales bacterium]|nr:hypothetical protein [Myxococcales bacterium]